MSGERGESTLVGLLVASTLFLGILGATLETFNLSERFVRNTGERADAQTAARTAADRIARELRSVDAPTGTAPDVVDRMEDDDLIVRAADSRAPNTGTNTPNTRRVRFCMDNDRRLWRAVQTWTTTTAPALPASGNCPGGWGGARVIAQDVATADLALQTFTYDNVDPKRVSAVKLTVAIDADRTRGIPPTRLETGVFLRNQNRPPSASFSAAVGGDGVVTLNASAASDPESAPMTFEWRDGTALLSCKSIVCTYDPAGPAAARTMTLTVVDANGLRASASQVVTA